MVPLIHQNPKIKQLQIQLILFVVIPFLIIFLIPIKNQTFILNTGVNAALYAIYPKLIYDILKKNKK